MSDQSIMATTQGLRLLLLSQLAAGRKVTLLPPGEELPDGSGVNLYLYRVTESPYLKNMPWPGDRGGMPPQPQPALSLDLFYLLTPFGPPPKPDDASDEAQRALGEAVLALHRYPILNRTHVPGFDADAQLPAYLLDSYEDLTVRHHPISLEELSTIWSTLGDPYRLTVAYEVSLVQLVAAEPARTAPGVVQTTSVELVMLEAPQTTALAPAAGALATLVGKTLTPARLAVSGHGLTSAGRLPTVRVGGTRITPAVEPTDREVVVELPDDLPAGPDVDVRVELDGLVSTPLTFRVEPWVSTLEPLRSVLALGGELRLRGQGLADATAVRVEGCGRSITLSPPAAGSDATTVVVAAPVGAPSNAPGTTTLANGVYATRVVLADGSVSNRRELEVIPLVSPFSNDPGGSSYAAASGALVLAGARLDGADVHLVVDGRDFALGRQTKGDRLAYVFKRPLAAGDHQLTVEVDGHRSHTIGLSVAG